ncbi:unnamed protein product [Thlaspi arvense]|uniref:Uncharacterized protein n=1 Tax=Thlaspi arvense TaxID=13288 RepID=A0AAU9S6G8_THLAR|nr:unnamed protein product [Thlaspi arvense]
MSQTRRRPKLPEDDIIKIMACDLVAVSESFKRTLIGRMFYREGRREGSSEGVSKATMSLQAMELCLCEAINKAMGCVVVTDAENARFQVSINVYEPLQFERRVGFPNGDIGKVPANERMIHRKHSEESDARINQEISQQLPWTPKDTLKRKRSQREEHRDIRFQNQPRDFMRDAREIYKSESQNPEFHPNNFSKTNLGTRERDLRTDLNERRQAHSIDVWKRLDQPNAGLFPRNRKKIFTYPKSGYEIQSRRNDTGNCKAVRKSKQTEIKDEETSRHSPPSHPVSEVSKGISDSQMRGPD